MYTRTHTAYKEDHDLPLSIVKSMCDEYFHGSASKSLLMMSCGNDFIRSLFRGSSVFWMLKRWLQTKDPTKAEIRTYASKFTSCWTRWNNFDRKYVKKGALFSANICLRYLRSRIISWDGPVLIWSQKRTNQCMTEKHVFFFFLG